MDDIILYNVLGGRGCGKTDYPIILASKLYQCFGCQTLWIRNKRNELSDEENYRAFLNDAHHFGWCPDQWVALEDGVFTSAKDGEQVIIFKSINTFSGSRGSGHPRVLFCCFDEMQPEDGRYYPNARMCVIGLLSLMETFTRGRDGAFLLVCSNYVTARNPYWARLRIYNNPKYDVTVFRDKACAIELCRGYKIANRKDSKLNRLKKAAGVAGYEDERSDPLIGLVEPIPKGAVNSGYVLLSNGLLYREKLLHGVSYWEEVKGDVPNKTIILTPNVSECGPGVKLMPKWLIKQMTEQMNNNLLRFKDPNVMFSVLDMIYDGGMV